MEHISIDVNETSHSDSDIVPNTQNTQFYVRYSFCRITTSANVYVYDVRMFSDLTQTLYRGKKKLKLVFSTNPCRLCCLRLLHSFIGGFYTV